MLLAYSHVISRFLGTSILLIGLIKGQDQALNIVTDSQRQFRKSGGRGEIRTHVVLSLTGFAVPPLRPLGHASIDTSCAFARLLKHQASL
jgi:hypothetical protein